MNNSINKKIEEFFGKYNLFYTLGISNDYINLPITFKLSDVTDNEKVVMTIEYILKFMLKIHCDKNIHYSYSYTYDMFLNRENYVKSFKNDFIGLLIEIYKCDEWESNLRDNKEIQLYNLFIDKEAIERVRGCNEYNFTDKKRYILDHHYSDNGESIFFNFSIANTYMDFPALPDAIVYYPNTKIIKHVIYWF